MKAQIFTVSSLLSALLLFMAVACTDSSSVDRVLDRADSLSSVKPDSALHLLDSLNDSRTLTTDHRPQTIDSCQQPTANSQRPARPEGALAQPVGARTAAVSRSQKMRLELLRARCMNKAYIPVGVDGQTPSDSVLLDVVQHYDRHGTPNEQMEAHYLLGCAYRDMGEAPHAVDCYLDAVAKADTTAEDCNYKKLSSIYSQLAGIYYYQLLLTKAIEMRKLSMKYAKLANDTLAAIGELKLSSAAYFLLNRRDSAEYVVKEAMRLYRINRHEQHAIQASTILMHIYCEDEGHEEELKSLIDNYDSGCCLFDSHHELSGNKKLYYYYKGRYLEYSHQLDSAEYYYRKIYHPDMALTAQNSMYKGLLSVFKKRHNADSIAKYAELYSAINDSSIILKDQQQTSIAAANYKYTSFQKQAHDSQLRAYKLKLYLVILTVFLLIATSATVFFVRQYRTKQQKKRELLEKKYQEELKKLIIRQQCKEEELECIRTELEERKGELARLEEINYREKMAQLLQEIEKLKEEKESVSRKLVLADRAREFTTLPIYKKIRQVAGHPRESVTEEEWQMLEESFCDHLPHLYHDVISLNDKNKPLRLHICILTAMGIRNGEQANMLDVTKQTITNNMSALNDLLFHQKTSRTFYSNLIEHYNIFV